MLLSLGCDFCRQKHDESKRLAHCAIDLENEFVGACRIIQHDESSVADSPDALQPSTSLSNVNLHVGVLHYTPSQEPFPLLLDPAGYLPDTTDLSDPQELQYWLNGLAGQIPMVVEKAITTDKSTPGEA